MEISTKRNASHHSWHFASPQFFSSCFAMRKIGPRRIYRGAIKNKVIECQCQYSEYSPNILGLSVNSNKKIKCNIFNILPGNILGLSAYSIQIAFFYKLYKDTFTSGQIRISCDIWSKCSVGASKFNRSISVNPSNRSHWAELVQLPNTVRATQHWRRHISNV